MDFNQVVALSNEELRKEQSWSAESAPLKGIGYALLAIALALKALSEKKKE